MEVKTTTVVSRVDGLPLSVLEVIPKREPWCLLQIVHGMCEYKERYLPFMEYMAKRGIVCMIHDHRGHGQSVQKAEDLGYMYGGGSEALVQDARLVTACLRKKYGKKLPLAILGHSMGSMVVRTYLKKYDHLPDAVILCGSPSRNPFCGSGKLLAWAEGKICGQRHPSRLMQTLSFGSYASRFAKEGSAYAWICSDGAVVREYEDSDLCGFPFTADGYQALLDLMGRTYAGKGWACRNPDLPILFISGGDDPCMGNVRKFKQALDHLRMQGYRRVRGRIYPGLRHELLNEYEKEKIYRNCYCFIREKLV